MKKSRSSRQRVFRKKGVPKNFIRSQENTSTFWQSYRSKMFQCQFWEIFNVTCFVKHSWMVAFKKSCSFGFNCTITDTICQTNFLAHYRLILLYYFHQKTLKEKTANFNTLLWRGLFFSSLRKPGLWVSRLYFSSRDILNYLHIK